MKDTPNILLVVFDTARADVFEPYGAAHGQTPAVSQLASTGLAHQSCFSTACWTVPAHVSLFAGLLPRSAGFGHEARVSRPATFVPPMHAIEDRLLPTVLRKHGYEAAGVSANLWISPHSGFDTGFDRFEHVPTQRSKRIGATGWKERAKWYLEALRADVDDGAAVIEAMLDDWLTRRGRRPFFWFVNLIECHSPYLPPRPYSPLGPLGRLRAAAEARKHLTLAGIWRACVSDFDVPPEALDRMRRLYVASIRQLDDWLARLMETLDRAHLMSETEIIVTSDHGENFGEGGLLGHAFSLDDRLLRVPFVAAGPLPPPALSPMSLANIPRWISEAAGIDDHPFREPDATPGVAVAQFDAPGTPGSTEVNNALRAWRLEGRRAQRATDVMSTSFTCATDGTLKLVRVRGTELLYDLTKDPLEQAPLDLRLGFDRPDDRLSKLRSALDRAEDHQRPAPGAAPAGSGAEARPEESDELEAQLKLLGYM